MMYNFVLDTPRLSINYGRSLDPNNIKVGFWIYLFYISISISFSLIQSFSLFLLQYLSLYLSISLILFPFQFLSISLNVYLSFWFLIISRFASVLFIYPFFISLTSSSIIIILYAEKNFLPFQKLLHSYFSLSFPIDVEIIDRYFTLYNFNDQFSMTAVI